MQTETFRGLRALLAAAIGVIVVFPIALAGASGPEASTSASAKKQIKSLKKRVAALEGRQTLPPSGAAGGDLTGSYPGPELRADSVGSPELAADGVGSAELAADSVGSAELVTDSVLKAELAQDSVGASELVGVTAVVGTGVDIDPGESAEATVTCPPGQMALGGGFEWGISPTEGLIQFSSPTFLGDPNTTWVVSGTIPEGGSANTLFAEVSCLAV